MPDLGWKLLQDMRRQLAEWYVARLARNGGRKAPESRVSFEPWSHPGYKVRVTDLRAVPRSSFGPGLGGVA